MSVPYALYAKNVENESQTLSDVLFQSNDGNAAQIKNLADPTDEQDAVTKSYVDRIESELSILKNTLISGGGLYDERDSSFYNTVQIGTQIWMAENLAWLPSVNLSTDVSNSVPYYYVYGFEGTIMSEAKETANYKLYGVLYNWTAAMNSEASSNSDPSGIQGACPTGWHLPSEDEWATLTNYLGGHNIAGGKFKKIWHCPLVQP